MVSPEFSQFLVMVLAALSAGTFILVLLYPFWSGERHQKRRISNVAGVTQGGRIENEQQQARRKQVTDTLKELNEKQKSNKKPSLRRQLAQAGLTLTVKTFYGISVLTGVVLVLFILSFGVSLIFALAGGLAGGYGLPRFVLKRLALRRQAKFLNEFANTIDIIVRGIKSGLPLNDCLEIISTESPEPIKSEFTQVVEQQRVGRPLMECFAKMGDRVPVPEVNFFSIVIAVQQQSGGNLAEALNNLSDVLRGRKRLQNKVKAFSSEAKSSAMIIGSLPFIIMVLVYLTSPDYISMLWTERMGHFLLAGSAVWMLLGVLVMRKMINFDY